jgi:hypothetical protein
MSEVLDRIKKLLSMANHERGNEHEQETAMRMANKLMLQHGIDAADLEAATGKASTYTWTSTTIPVGERATRMVWRPLWTGFLGYGIAQFTDCKLTSVDDQTYGVCVKFQGDEADVEFAGWLFKKLRDFGYAESKSVAGRHRNTFLKAYSMRVGDRMKKLRAERDAAMKAAVTKSGTALIVVQNKLMLRDAEFGRQRVRTTRVKFASDGYVQGRAAGNRANFNRPIGGSASSRQLT